MQNSPISTTSSNDLAESRSPSSGILGRSPFDQGISGSLLPGQLAPGTLFQNTYRIVHKLGEGSLGPVYLADHLILDEPRALRILPRRLAHDEVLLARFRHELSAFREVRSKNVIGAGDLQFSDDETPFVAMEYVNGPDLRTILDLAPGQFDVGLGLAITRCIAEGLIAAHACGVVHRDLKPKNIFLARSGNSWLPKIAGFAFVAIKEHIASPRATGETVLSPIYAAPEQWYGTDPTDLDGRTDLYALGGLLYEMLTGHTAFHAADYEGWAMQHIKTQPLPPSALRPDITPRNGIDSLTLRLLAKEPEARPRRASELLPILDALEFGTAFTAPPSVKSVAQEPPAAPPAEPVLSAPAQSIDSAPILTATQPEVSVPSQPASQVPASQVPASQAPASVIPASPIEEASALDSAPPAILAEAEPAAPVEELSAPAATPEPLPQPPAPFAAETAVAPQELPDDDAGFQSLLRRFTRTKPDQELEAPPKPPASEPIILPELNATEEQFDQPAETAEPDESEASAAPASADLAQPGVRSDLWKAYDFRRVVPAVETSPEVAPAQPAPIAEAQELSVSAASEALAETPKTPAEPVPAPVVEEPPVVLTPEQKELAELRRIFAVADASGGPDKKHARTARIARISAFSEAQILSSTPTLMKAPLASEGVPATVLDQPAVNPDTTPEPASKAETTGETTTDRFSHPVLKVMAALLLICLVGFAGWRLNSTDPTQPPKKLAQGCNAGDAKVCSQLAEWYEQTNTVKNGDLKAVTYYAKACDGSLPLACRKLGFKYLFGKGIPEDKPRALPLLAKACSNGDYQSCDVLAELYHNGNDVQKDDEQASKFYSKSCSLGEEFGCKWAAQLDALNHPAPPPVRKPRPSPAVLATSTPAPTPAPATEP